jgi:Cu(I)/Ag(I) efflux system membrane protein CusA/SilA
VFPRERFQLLVQRLIDGALRHRALVLTASVALGIAGWWAYLHTPIDAIPDLSDNQVIVFTDWPGHSPQEVEDQVTYPLTVNLQGLAGVRAVRSQSAFGFSMIYVVFEDEIDLYFARSRVLERLNLVTRLLPETAVPTLGPDATGVGHVFWYTLESPNHTLRELRTLQDWFVRYQLNAVPGVAEVASVGGHVQQYQIDVDPDRLRTFGVTLGDVITAVRDSNSNVGGNVLEANGAWTIVRGVGLVEAPDDLAQAPLRAKSGAALTVADVATVKLGDAFRVASLVKGQQEAVGGVVVARAGVNAQEVIDGVKARIAQIEQGLPEGVRLVPFYDRSTLIEQAVGTLQIALLEEIALVTLVHIVFLRHLRSILIVTAPLPLAVLGSFLFMYFAGITSNIMSLAGIAIAIGVLVDAGIVVTENAFRTAEMRHLDTRDRGAVWQTVRDATRLVGRPVFFSMAIILLAFVPVFALTGQEGKLFHPLAWTKTFAVLTATVLAVTLVPVLCTLLLSGTLKPEEANPVMRVLRRVYRPVLEAALAHRALSFGVAVVLFVAALLLGSRIGSEFMPPLNEGDLMFMPIADPSISLEENTDIAKRQNAVLLEFPEVEWVVAKVARADTSTDPAPLNMTETIVHLKPRDEWRAGMTLDRLRGEMGARVQLPGVTNIWTMPIINRIDMLTTGIRSEIGVKVFGPDLQTIERLAGEIARVVRTVPGAANVYPERVTSGQYLNIEIDRAAAARYGLSVGAIQEVIETAIGETPQGLTIEGRQRFPIRVRYAPEFRSDSQMLGTAQIATPDGSQVPLSSVARLVPARGPAMITSENGLLVVTVLLNVQGRDPGSVVRDAAERVAREVRMPAGSFVAWSGRFEAEQRARDRLELVIPIVLAVIFTLLYATYRSWTEAAHVLLAVPFALTGGVFLLWLLGYNFSVAVWVGFIALFGTAVQTAMVMVVYLNEAVERKRAALGEAFSRASLREAVIEGALLRLRPKVMTASTVIAALLPLMWSTRIGADVMKPLATPVLGGMASSLLHVLVLTPVLFFWVRERELAPLLAAEDRGGAGPPLQPATPEQAARTRRPRWPWLVVGAVLLIALAISQRTRIWPSVVDDEPGAATTGAPPLRSVTAGDLRIDVFAPTGSLRLGTSSLLIEFRSTATGELVDVGSVQAGISMSMPGMPMAGTAEVSPAGRGRYGVTTEVAMAGTWRLTVQWSGPAGQGSQVVEVDAQ